MSAIDLRYCVLAVKSPKWPELVIGTAFLVSRQDDGYAVTCYHSIGNHSRIELWFEPVGLSIPAELVPELSNKDMDIAIVKLLRPPPAELKVLRLSPEECQNRNFESYGFPKDLKGLRARGTIDGLVASPKETLKTLEGGIFQLRTYDVAEGMSGAPVVLSNTDRVVGTIVLGYKAQSIGLAHVAYAQPVEAILRTWPKLREGPHRIHNKQEWLDAIGLSEDPFEYPDGGKDPDLKSYYYFSTALYFQEVLERTETVFIFADSGCGKSAYRNALSQSCLNGSAGALILPVAYLSLEPLVQKSQQGLNVGPQDHVELVLKEGLSAFSNAVHEGVTRRSASTGREDRDYMWRYVQEYGKHLTLWEQIELRDMLEPSEGAGDYPLPEDYADRLRNFCKTITNLGFARVYFLVDPDISNDTEWSVFLSLLSDRRVLDLSGGRGAFKFFLDRQLMGAVRSMPAVSTEMMKLSPLEWSTSDLYEMLLTRLAAKATGSGRTSPESVLGKMFERSDSANRVLEKSQGNPRRLVTFFNQIISEHCKSMPFYREHVPISDREVEKVIQESKAYGREPPSFSLVESTEQIDALVIKDLISGGENERVELKSTMRCNAHTGKRDKQVEKKTAATLSAFMNCEGGTLLIGVDDERNTLGLARDFFTLRKKDTDGFELALTDIIQNYLGVEYGRYIRCKFVEVDSQQVCVIDVARSNEPVYVKASEGTEFYVRVGNSTRKLDVEAAVKYVRSHWWPDKV